MSTYPGRRDSVSGRPLLDPRVIRGEQSPLFDLAVPTPSLHLLSPRGEGGGVPLRPPSSPGPTGKGEPQPALQLLLESRLHLLASRVSGDSLLASSSLAAFADGESRARLFSIPPARLSFKRAWSGNGSRLLWLGSSYIPLRCGEKKAAKSLSPN